MRMAFPICCRATAPPLLIDLLILPNPVLQRFHIVKEQKWIAPNFSSLGKRGDKREDR